MAKSRCFLELITCKHPVFGYNMLFSMDLQAFPIVRRFGKVLFDGEYKDGSGVSGTTFYENGNPRYKGEWKEGNYNGEGIQYWESGEKRYDGSWNNGKRDGYGTSYRLCKDLDSVKKYR